MSRTLVAAVVGIVGFVTYVVAVVTLGDRVATANWLLQALYFIVTGVLWVIPARWLILWAVRPAA